MDIRSSVDSAEKLNEVTSRGLPTLVNCSYIRKRLDLAEYLDTNPIRVLVHNSCRKRFTDLRKVADFVIEDDGNANCKRLRSTVETFQWKQMCFFCCKIISFETEAIDSFRRISTLEIAQTVRHFCEVRQDQWALDVKTRLELCNDRVAPEAVYHKNCHTRFLGLKRMEADGISGRRVDEQLSNTFKLICEWLEESYEQNLYSLEELQHQMTKNAVLCADGKAIESLDEMGGCYSTKHLKRKLQEKYGDHIIFAEVSGKTNVVCFHDFGSFLINDKWYSNRKDSSTDENERIVRSAAKLRATQVREIQHNVQYYPNPDEMKDTENQFFPPLLKSFRVFLFHQL
jgi:hypothetical protein